jgi:hypothetical protein
MAKRTLAELYDLLGTQPAEYVDQFLREHRAHAATCAACGKLFVVERKPGTKAERDGLRCGECLPREATSMEARG